MLDWRPKGRKFEPYWHHCVVSLSKNINPSLVLVQPRKTCPFITEGLLIGHKESKQTTLPHRVAFWHVCKQSSSRSELPDQGLPCLLMEI